MSNLALFKGWGWEGGVLFSDQIINFFFFYRKVAGAFRVMAGRKSIPSNLGDTLKTRNHSLDHLFSSKTLNIEIKRKNSESDSEDNENDFNEEKSYVNKVRVRSFFFIVASQKNFIGFL